MHVAGETPSAQPTACPHCGLTFHAACSATGDGAKPSAGAVTICTRCGGLAAYDSELMPRVMTPEQTARFAAYQGGFAMALLQSCVEKYHATLDQRALAAVIYHEATGRWPEEDGIQEPPAVI